MSQLETSAYDKATLPLQQTPEGWFNSIQSVAHPKRAQARFRSEMNPSLRYEIQRIERACETVLEFLTDVDAITNDTFSTEEEMSRVDALTLLYSSTQYFSEVCPEAATEFMSIRKNLDETELDLGNDEYDPAEYIASLEHEINVVMRERSKLPIKAIERIVSICMYSLEIRLRINRMKETKTGHGKTILNQNISVQGWNQPQKRHAQNLFS